MHIERENIKPCLERVFLDYDVGIGSAGLRGQAVRNNTVSGGGEKSVQREIFYAYFSVHYIHPKVIVLKKIKSQHIIND